MRTALLVIHGPNAVFDGVAAPPVFRAPAVLGMAFARVVPTAKIDFA